MKNLIKAPESNTIYSNHCRQNRATVYIDPDTKKKFFALWKRIEIPESTYDKTYRVTTGTAYRPDLISYNFYDTPYLSWVICMVNNIKNPLDLDEGLYAGRLIVIPDLNTLMTILAV